MNFRTMLLTTITLAGALMAGTSQAHSDADLDRQATPHQGQVRMAGSYHFELVVARQATPDENTPVQVYVTDHEGHKVSTTGATGTATILAGKTKTVVTLSPGGDNLMKGDGHYVPASDMKAVVSITLDGKASEQARFTPLAKAGEARQPHTQHQQE